MYMCFMIDALPVHVGVAVQDHFGILTNSKGKYKFPVIKRLPLHVILTVPLCKRELKIF